MKSFLILLCLVCISGTAVWGQDLSEGPGRDIVIKNCTNCHTPDLIVQTRHTKAEWKSVIDAMINYGAQITDNDVEAIAAYLAANYGKNSGSAENGSRQHQRTTISLLPARPHKTGNTILVSALPNRTTSSVPGSAR